ncbi:lactate utilization protein C [Bacillus sp. B15-48]|uniref:LutC/YkgG family protein n=1 Tax=Bacillus sp. B15-48 TaxID=1548601 RepID=UPI00193F5571|nr:lactate utilization protein C [Bacillus sp. B15-48]MBM4761016.1 lactate utilization protein C [Bacillus sp. B15-48]
MAIQNREAFLNKVATSLGRPRRTEGVERPSWSVSPQNDVFKGASQDELVDILAKHCEVIHTKFKQTDTNGLKDVLLETIRGFGGKSVIASNDARIKDFGLSDFYQKLGEEAEVHIWDHKLGTENQKIAERADVGIVFSDITLAETATVTLFNDKNNGRTISLLPTAFVAIIPKSTIVPRITQATKKIHEAEVRGEVVPSTVSFISGPSNSADIEMNLIVGVHGPVYATYIVVEDQ